MRTIKLLGLFKRLWRNWQTHKIEGLDRKVIVGSSPTSRTNSIQIVDKPVPEESPKCCFSFVKDGKEFHCSRKPTVQLDGKQFCKHHAEVYVIEDFDVLGQSNLSGSVLGNKPSSV